MDAGLSSVSGAHSPSWLCDIPLVGSEDIAIDHRAGIAYVSSQDRRKARWLIPGVLGQRQVDWAEQGRIYRVDLRNGFAVQEMPLRASIVFHPVGIDLYVAESGDRRLFVVNWRTATQFSIEVFDVVDGGLSHHATATTSSLTLPNDIVAVGEAQFYVTNSLSLPPLLQGAEAACRLPTGNALYHDLDVDSADKWKLVASGIPYANGLALDRKRNRLFVASSLSSRILAFPWDWAKPGEPLAAADVLHLQFLPDNLAWQDEDTLWAAGSEFLAGIPYTLLLSEVAPSHVASIGLAAVAETPDAERRSPFLPEYPPFGGIAAERPSLFADVRAVYDNDGSEIAACSVGAPFEVNGDRGFMVGCCYDDHLSVFRMLT